MVLRFGATHRAETNDEVVTSEANLNLMFTHSCSSAVLNLLRGYPQEEGNSQAMSISISR